MTINLLIKQGTEVDLKSDSFVVMIAEQAENRIIMVTKERLKSSAKFQVKLPREIISKIMLRNKGKFEYAAFVLNEYGQFARSNVVPIVVAENTVIEEEDAEVDE